MPGFLGFGAPLHADINLLIQLGMGTALVVGKFLARRQKYRAHQICQTSVVLLNLVLIASVMAPSFTREVVPNSGKITSDLYYAVAAVHASLGVVAELLAIYVVLVAGTSWLPERVKFKNYKMWMGPTLALWWVVILLGIGIYVRWYMLNDSAGNAPPALAPVDSAAVVTVANFQFSPPTLTIPAGTTVAWADTLGRHIIELDDGSFTSETLFSGARVTHRFGTPGTFLYHCQLHGAKGGSGMSATIVVTPK